MANVNTKEIDWGRVQQLLAVVKEQSTVAPTMVYLTSAAMSELREINDAIEQAARKGQEVPPQEPLTDADPTEPRPDLDLQQRLELPYEHPGQHPKPYEDELPRRR